MPDKIEISVIVIKFGKQKVALTLGEAKKLKSALEELMPSPSYIPIAPIMIERNTTNPYRFWDYPITCQSGQNAAGTSELTCSL